MYLKSCRWLPQLTFYGCTHPSINAHLRTLASIYVYLWELAFIYECFHISAYMETNFRICTFTENFHIRAFTKVGNNICTWKGPYTKSNFSKCAFTEGCFRNCAYTEVDFCICAYMEANFHKWSYTEVGFHISAHI